MEMTHEIAVVVAAAAGIAKDQVRVLFEVIDAKDWLLARDSVTKF